MGAWLASEVCAGAARYVCCCPVGGGVVQSGSGMVGVLRAYGRSQVCLLPVGRSGWGCPAGKWPWKSNEMKCKIGNFEKENGHGIEN